MLRRAVLAIALAAGSLGVFQVAVPAQARGVNGCGSENLCTWEWFNPAEPNIMVGGLQELCDGSVVQWGVQTVDVEFTEEACA